MIQFAYLGKGGRYSAYLQESVRHIRRFRPAEIINRSPRSGKIVAIHQSGNPLTTEALRAILTTEEDVVFLVGDSTGISEALLRGASAVVSVSSLPVEHGMEAAIVASQIEKLLIGG